MRKLVAIVWVSVLLAGPAYAVFHGHMIGHTDDNCLACHLKSNPAEQVEMPILEARPGPTADAPVCRPRVSDLRADPLRVAPKTSPPSFSAA